MKPSLINFVSRTAEYICVSAAVLIVTPKQNMTNVLLVFFVAVILTAQAKPNQSQIKDVAQKYKLTRSEEWCRNKFSWNEDMKQVKLLDDCEITKKQLTLKDSVERITDKTECITLIDLHVDDIVMKTWENVGGRSLVGRAVTFENLLHEQNRHRQARVSVTARNPVAEQQDFHINFDVDSSNCHGLVEAVSYTHLRAHET